MPVTEIDLEKAALLHDIGKLYQRAGKIRKSHSLVGQELLSHFFDADHQAILRAVAHHHQNELQAAHLPDDDISYIVYEADNLAAASDRRALIPEGAQEGSGMHFVSDLPLSSIFNVFDHKGDTDAAGYRLKTIEENEPWVYPDHQNHIAAPAASYEKSSRCRDGYLYTAVSPGHDAVRIITGFGKDFELCPVQYEYG